MLNMTLEHTHWTGIAQVLVRQSDSDVSLFSSSPCTESTPETQILSTIGFLLRVLVLELKFEANSNCIFYGFRACLWKYV